MDHFVGTHTRYSLSPAGSWSEFKAADVLRRKTGYEIFLIILLSEIFGFRTRAENGQARVDSPEAQIPKIKSTRNGARMLKEIIKNPWPFPPDPVRPAKPEYPATPVKKN